MREDQIVGRMEGQSARNHARYCVEMIQRAPILQDSSSLMTGLHIQKAPSHDEAVKPARSVSGSYPDKHAFLVPDRFLLSNIVPPCSDRHFV